MRLKQDLEAEVEAILGTSWQGRGGREVPEPEDVRLGNDAVMLDATVLYADMADSTALVTTYHWWFAAQIYKAYLISACRIIRQNSGVITAFDGDRVMAVYVEEGRDAAAARTALQIRFAVERIINPAIQRRFATDFAVKQVVGIDRGILYAARTGIRGSNDLVWVGTAANYAAKLSSVRDGYATHVTDAVYRNLDNSTIYVANNQHMWMRYCRAATGLTMHCSNYCWEP